MIKSQWLHYGMEEIKFIGSLHDLKQFYTYKWPFLKSRLTRNYVRTSEAPLSMQIEPTNHCNLNCIRCPRNNSVREKGFMDFGLFKSIIDDAWKCGVRRAYLYLHGEPTLHRDISDMIGYVKRKNMAVSMVTNGMLMTKGKSEAIIESGMTSLDYLIFSILGYSKGVHEFIMKGVTHEKVEENLYTLMELKQQRGKGPIVETMFYNMPENEHEKKQFLRHWRGVADHARITGRAARKKSCRNLWERMTVYWNGDVTRCNADLNGEHVYGNLRGHSIKELWNSAELIAIKKVHREKASLAGLQMCSTCDW